jgi:hypothetical protein
MRVAHVYHPTKDPQGMYEINKKQISGTRKVKLSEAYVDWYTVTVHKAQLMDQDLVRLFFYIGNQEQSCVALSDEYLRLKSTDDATITN